MRQSALAFATFLQFKPGPFFLPGNSIITNLGIYKVSTDESKTSGSGM
jgi:hypothetical protein